MPSLAYTISAFVIALIILIAVHEFGHFWVARKLGVKVLRFSLGFGKPLLSRRDKSGTEYVLSLIPLGGYVKMLDEREVKVPEAQRHLAFNTQPLWKRAAIVMAGPLFNFLFAIVAYWCVYTLGVTSIMPVIGAVTPGSVAAQGGLPINHEIVAIDKQLTPNWTKVNLALFAAIGDEKSVEFTLRDIKSQQVRQTNIDVSDWKVDKKQPRPATSFGIEPYFPSLPTVIATVVPDTPAAKVGLKANDRIIAVDGKRVKDWNSIVRYIRVHPQKKLQLEVKRGSKQFSVVVKPDVVKTRDGRKVPQIGMKSTSVDWPPEFIKTERYSILAAWWPALKHTYSMILLTFVMLGKLLVGKLSLQSISGPVGIAIGAGKTAQIGFTYYLNFLALVSLSLGVLNILPIPVLDGGHLLYFLVEAIQGKPVSEKIETAGLKFGLLLLLGLMILALFNDVSRLIG